MNSCNSVQQHILVDSWPMLMDSTIFSCICCSLRFFCLHSKNLATHKHSPIGVGTIYLKRFCLLNLMNYYFHKEYCQYDHEYPSLQTYTVLLVKFFTSLSFRLILAFKNGITDRYGQKRKAGCLPCCCAPANPSH